MRPVMEEAYETLRRGKVPIVVAPTGYGKTAASPEIYRRVVDDSIASGLIHVAPLRALVKEIYDDHFSKVEGSGYQSSDSLPGAAKSPYYLRSLVVTTLESYFWNIFKIPVAEYSKIAVGGSEGHYYPVLGSIASSVNVLDEAHLYLESGSREASSALALSIILFLAYTGIPLVVETATMPSALIRDIAGKIKDSGLNPEITALDTGSGSWAGKLKSMKARMVADRDFVKSHSIKWATRTVGGLREALESACEDAGTGKRVLIALNTVPRAIAAYKYLVDDLDCETVLLHGRLSEADKNRSTQAIKSISGGVIVATQTLEAGVDVNAHTVYTDPAPMESLAQRVGRLCRRDKVLEECRGEGAHVGIVRFKPGEVDEVKEPYMEDTVRSVLEKMKDLESRNVRVEWRLPACTCNAQNCVSFADLLEELSEYSSGFPGIIIGLARGFRSLLEGEPAPSYVLGLLDRIGVCSFTGSSLQARILVDEGPEDYVAVDYAYMTRNWGALRDSLSWGEALRIKCPGADGLECTAKNLTGYLEEASRAPRGRVYCRRLNYAVRRDLEDCGARGYLGDLFILAPEGFYKKGLGIALDVERAERVYNKLKEGV